MPEHAMATPGVSSAVAPKFSPSTSGGNAFESKTPPLAGGSPLVAATAGSDSEPSTPLDLCSTTSSAPSSSAPSSPSSGRSHGSARSMGSRTSKTASGTNKKDEKNQGMDSEPKDQKTSSAGPGIINSGGASQTGSRIVDQGDVVVIIGAGLSGSFAAREIAKKRKVWLIEKEDDIIPEASSSVAECYKLHLGLHYAGDLATAIQCLERSVQFARENAEFILGKPGDPCRRGRHYLLSNSLTEPFKVKGVIGELKKRYAELIAQDTKNKVFGELEDFIKILNEKDYPEVAKEIDINPLKISTDSKHQKAPAKVVLAVETAESQIDIKKLKASLKQALESNKNVTILKNIEVVRSAYAKDKLGYVLTLKHKNGEVQELQAPVVVNSAWQNIEKIEKQMGYCAPNPSLVIRIKVSLVIQLPDELRNTNTAIFSVGPYISLTNQGDGTAILTAEEFTNVGHYWAGAEHKTLPRRDDNDLFLNEKQLDLKDEKVQGAIAKKHS